MNAIEESLLNADHEALGFLPSQNTEQTPNDFADQTAALAIAARKEIETGIVQLESLLNSTIDKTFDKLEIYTLRNLLTVSNRAEDDGLENWILLDHYRNIQAQPSTDGDRVTPQSVDLLRRKVHETEKLHAALRAEEARNEALLARLRPMTQPQSTGDVSLNSFQTSPENTTTLPPQSQPSFAFLSETPAAASLGLSAGTTSEPITQNAQFTLSQLPALKALVDELRPYLKTTGQPASSNDTADARREYIDSQGRRAMARQGVDAEMVTVNGVGQLGRPTGADEIRSLQGIAASLDGKGPSADIMQE